MADVRNVFVLMLENRSFDHMLGFSAITGFDAATGAPTAVDGLDGTESNPYQGQSYTVTHPAPDTMPVDPGHEFVDVLMQLCGPGAVYASGAAYPPIDNSGFVADYVESPCHFSKSASTTGIDFPRFALPNSAAIVVEVRCSRLQYVIVRCNTLQAGDRHGRPVAHPGSGLA